MSVGPGRETCTVEKVVVFYVKILSILRCTAMCRRVISALVGEFTWCTACERTWPGLQLPPELFQFFRRTVPATHICGISFFRARNITVEKRASIVFFFFFYALGAAHVSRMYMAPLQMAKRARIIGISRDSSCGHTHWDRRIRVYCAAIREENSED